MIRVGYHYEQILNGYNGWTIVYDVVSSLLHLTSVLILWIWWYFITSASDRFDPSGRWVPMCSLRMSEDLHLLDIYAQQKRHTQTRRDSSIESTTSLTHTTKKSAVYYIYVYMPSIKRERHSLTSLTTTVMVLTTSRLGAKCYHHHIHSPLLRNRRTGLGTHIFRHIRSFI